MTNSYQKTVEDSEQTAPAQVSSSTKRELPFSERRHLLSRKPALGNVIFTRTRLAVTSFVIAAIFVLGVLQLQHIQEKVFHHHAELTSSDPVGLNVLDDNVRLLKISKGFGARGYDFVRVSAITIKGSAASRAYDVAMAENASVFTYSRPFKYRWQQFHLHSGLVKISFKANIQTVQLKKGEVVTLRIPKTGSGVRGVVMSDPCYSSRFVTCKYGDVFLTEQRTPKMLHALLARDDMSFLGILGDNYYDKDGNLTWHFNKGLSSVVESKVLLTVPGNHDYWIRGYPSAEEWDDQFGNGFMQFYAQDTVSAFKYSEAGLNEVYDFGVNPDKAHPVSAKKADMTNFLWYNAIGNLAFIGYSGAYDYNQTESFMEEACSWLGQMKDTVSVAVLVGHWNAEGDGCGAGAAVPAVHSMVSALDGCSDYEGRLLWMAGHTHCNINQEQATGWLVGGQGMNGCAQYGFPVIDTTGGRLRIFYFPVSAATQPAHVVENYDNYHEIYTCLEKHGFEGCTDFAAVWLNESIAR